MPYNRVKIPWVEDLTDSDLDEIVDLLSMPPSVMRTYVAILFRANEECLPKYIRLADANEDVLNSLMSRIRLHIDIHREKLLEHVTALANNLITLQIYVCEEYNTRNPNEEPKESVYEQRRNAALNKVTIDLVSRIIYG